MTATMAMAGYDPREAVAFWERFSKAVGGAPPAFLSDHPSSSSRISDLKSRLAQVLPLYERLPQKFGLGEKI